MEEGPRWERGAATGRGTCVSRHSWGQVLVLVLLHRQESPYLPVPILSHL